MKVLITVMLAGLVTLGIYSYWSNVLKPRNDGILDIRTVIDLDGLPAKGRQDAKVVLIEFSDYECPFCARHANGVGKELDKKYVNSGLVRHVFANNPLPIHPDAKKLATAALCAGQQQRYWEMHDELFDESARSLGELVALARDLRLTIPEFEKCVDNAASAETQIEHDQRIAQVLNITGTPTFAFGIMSGKNHADLTKLVSGARPFAVFEQVLSELIN